MPKVTKNAGVHKKFKKLLKDAEKENISQKFC